MDEQKVPSEEKDAAAPADGVMASEEMGSAEGDPLKPPEGASAGPEPDNTGMEGPPEAGSLLGRRCALCNCGDWSLHGQRELQRFEPVPDWPERLVGHEPPDGPGQPPPGPSQLPPEPELAGNGLAQIGFSEGVTPAQLFEPTGHCWVHHWCAAWAAGAGPEEAGVARAVFSGISQKCERCGRAGATIPCRAAAGCSRLYHFPCAAASGCFQSMKTLRLLCPEHVAEAVDTEDARCSVCNGPGDLRDLVFCTSCGQHFHGACLDISLTPRKRSGWQCPQCKVCQTCRQPGQDSAMLVCEACDKGYHTSCTEPATQGLPTGSWKCKNCWVCSDCGQHPAGPDSSCQWSLGSEVCRDCQQRRAMADVPMAPEHSPQPDLPAQMFPHLRSESPVPSKLTDAPVPPPELEPVGCDEETQPLMDPSETPSDPKEAPPDPKEAPPGNPESPPGELASVEVPPSEEPPEELPSDELPLDQPPPNIQPSDIQPPEVQPPEEPLPLMLPPEEPPSEELPLETPSLAELSPDRPSLEELPPSEPPHNEVPLDVPPLAELSPEKPAFEKSPPHELPPEVLPIDKSPPDELPPIESPPKPPLEEPPLSEPSLNELPLNKPPLEELPPNELPPDELPPSEPPPIELLPKGPPPEALPPEKLSPEEPPLVELPPEEPVPSELPPEEDLKPPGLLPEVTVAEEAPALAPEVLPEEEMELEPEPSLPPEMTPPPSAPPALRAISPARTPAPSPDAKEDEVLEPPTPALPEPPGSPGIAMDTDPPGSPPPPLGSPAVTLAPAEPPEDEEMEMAGGEGESPASPPGDAPHGSPAPELGPFPVLPEEEEEEEEEAPRLEREGTSGSSPPLSEEDALEESRAGGDPEVKGSPSGSPLLLEPEELGPETPMEVCTTGEKLLGHGDEGCPEPPALRPRPDILNEISNLSQGDTSSSFPGSEPLLGSPDPEGGGSLSPELGPASADASLQKEDAGSLPLGAETDDSLLFEPAAKGDGDKSRRRSSPGRSRVKQGRSSSFPGRRRPRGGSHGGRGRGRARLKSTTSSVDTLALADVESSPSKEEDEDDDDTMQNTVVLFSNTDKFVLMQDMCVVCGSFGRGAEGHLLACSQCSQCYHPYCVNSKITKVMLLKGWRCVECIVCEVCGKASDPSRLLLCDDCDISYHTYCLDPPLQTVPKGGWKCKWCVCCVQCGAASPGFHCEWQNNYTHCAPCASLVVCPFCREKYVEDDLLIQCRHCDRWLHAACDSLFTEEEVEQAADEGFDCSACQPYVVKPVPAPSAEMIKAKDPEPQYFRFEGVWLTETGMAVLRNLTLSPLHKRRQRKGRPGTLNGDGGLEGGDPLGPEDKKDGDLDTDELLKADAVGVEHMECEIKLETPASPDRDVGADGDSGKGLEDPEECKKRKRKPYRPGIGGFMVRQRKSHTRLKKVSAVLPDVGREGLSTEGHPEDGAPGDVPAETGLDPGSGEGDEKKKRRGRKKSKLEDMFPPYLQEAFFGKALMDLSRKALLAAGGVGDGAARPALGQGAPRPKGDPSLAGALQGGTPDRRETPTHPRGEDSTDGSAAAPDDDGKDDAKAEELGADEPKDSPDRGDTEKPATPGEGALSSDLDKIPTEELPKMESKDVQQLFKDVLGSAERGEQPLNCVAAGMEAGQDPSRAQRPFLQGDLQLSGQGSVSLGSLSGSVSLDSFSGVCQSPFLDNRERSGFFSPDHCEPESPWASSSAATTPSTPTTPTTEGEGDGLSYNQRSLQRWEKDEELGELSTISPVLYANMNFPNLKQDYPDWSSRCKQIMKLWRKVPATDKAPYLQKAKDNRAAHRINKVQKQAESQINKQTKGEGLRKPERPSLHLRIPVPPGAQPVYISSPPATGEGFLKPPTGAGGGPESPSELFLKLPPQSPAQVPSHDPYGAAPAYTLEPRFPSPLGQSPTSGAAFQPFPSQPQPLTAPRAPPDFHPTPPGTPRHQPGTPDPFLKPRCPSLDNLSVPGSPGARPPEALLSPLPFGEQKKGLEVKKEDGGSLGVCSPGYTSAMGYGDSPGGPHLTAAELKAADVFKAPMTPRVSQVEPQSPGLGHRAPDPHSLAPSPPGHPDLYRQSPYLDPYSQPPLTPRLQPPEACCALPPRSLPSEPFSRIPASPQSQSSSQSPLTPRPLSNEAFCQSPVTPRFQSPDPYSQPPSRPQSRDPFTPLHKPPRPQMPEPGFKSVGAAGGGFGGTPAGDPHTKTAAGPQPPFARSPGASVFPASQPPMRFTFPPAVSEPLKGSPSHQPHGINSHYGSGKPQSSAYASSPSFHQASSPLGPGTAAPDSYSLSPLRPPSVLPPQPPAPPQQQDPSGAFLPRTALGLTADKREEVAAGLSAPPNRDLVELPGAQDGALGTMSQSELEKQRQRQRLRELLIRQQIQRNSLRQEKESAAAAASSSPAGWAPESGQSFELSRGMAPYQPAQDKALLGTLATAAGAGKLPGSVMVQAAFTQDERLSRPPPAATPAMLDISGRAAVGPPQAFYPRGVFPSPSPQQQQQHLWQQQQQQQAAVAALRLPVTSRFAPPAAGTPMGSLGTRLPTPAEAVPPSPAALGAPFIELRHNVQKGPGGVVGSPFAPQAPRPRFFLPGEEGTPQALCTPVMPLQALPSQKVPAPLPPASPQGAEMGNSHQQAHAKAAAPLPAPTLELQQHIPPRPLSSGATLRPEGPKDGPAPDPAPAPGKSHLSLEGGRLPCEVPVEPDLDDDFGSHKDLEDDDDLANLSLDPDVAKGDDDLDNLDSLETADPHLDDLLNGDEFDLLAYTDPELDTGDKKDIFNEHLRLVESANEKAEREAQLKTEPPAPTLKLPDPGDSKDVTPSAEDQEVPKEGLVSGMGLGLSACPTGTVLAPDPAFKAQGAEAKAGSLPTDVKPKLEDGCLKTSPCQFTTPGPERLPVPVKSEALQGTDKISASLGLSVKPGQTLLSSSTGPTRLSMTQFSNSGHTGVPMLEKDPYTGPGRGLATAQLGGQSNPLLEKFELDSGALGLGSARHSPADDLDKMESSLVASELPLLIEDLLEHEKKELQKKQQMSAHLPRGTPHLQAPGHPMLHTGASGQPPEGQPPRLGTPQTPLQLGLVARPPLLPPQPPRLNAPQQGPALAPHMGMGSGQPHVLSSPHGVQVALGQPQQSQQQVLVQKPMAGVQPPTLGLKPPQLVMQQQLANSFFPDTADLDKFAAEDIMDPIAKAKMVALKGIKKVMAQGSIGVAPGMNRQQVSLLAQRLSGGPAVSEMQNHLLAGSGQERSGTDPTQARPNPPTFAQGVINEADQRQYEEWLFHTQQLLQMQLKVLEEQIGAHRKSRKALCAKQRTAKKAGREFPEADAEKLKLVTEQQSKIQKQLDQVRKQQKEHTNLMAEYRNKQQQHQHQASAVMALSPSQSPRLMSKLPGQLLSAHGVQQPGAALVGAQGLGQQPGQPGGLRLPQGGVSMAVQQGLSFMGQQPVGNAPGPGSSGAFFSGNPALRGLAADSRLMQERQLQRMQLAQKLQQQNMLGQVSLQQQPGVMGQASMQQPGVMGQVSLQQPGVMGQAAMQQQGVMGQTSMQQPGVMGQAAMQQSGVMGQAAMQQSGVMGQTSLQPSGVMAQASMQQQGVMGQSSMQQPGVMGQASLQQPGVMAQASMQQPGVMGQTSMQQQGVMGQSSMQQPSLIGQSSMQPQSIMAQTSMQQSGVMGQTSMQQAGVLAQTSLQQPGMMGQASMQQPGVLGQAPVQPTAVPGQPSLLGQQQQQPPAPQPGAGAQPMVPKQPGLLGSQQSLLVQQLSPQQQPGVLGHGPGLQHQPVLGHPPAQRQVVLAPHQQRVLGSPQLTPQTPGMLSHRLVLSQQLGQSRALLAPQQQQQQQNSAVAAQPGLLGLGQGQPSIQHFPQHGAGGQAPSVLHLSQGMQPAPAVLAAKDQPAGMDGSTLHTEGGESGGQLHGEQQGALNPAGLGGPEPPAPKHQAELGQGQQLLLTSPQPGVLRAAPGQPGALLAPPLQSPGAVHPELSQQHGDTAGVVEQPLGCGTGPAQAMVPAPRPPEQPGKGVAGALPGQPQPPRLQSPVQHKVGPVSGTASLPPSLLGQVPGPVMGQIRAQLQGVLAKNPQLRHLTPQQQQQLQALLVQRHQQSLLQQNQALRTPGPFPGQAPDYSLPATRQPPRPMGSLFQPRADAPAEAQSSSATEPGRALPGQPPQQPLAELVQAALAARGPQPGLIRLPTPPAPSPLGCAPQHLASPEQSPQEPKKTSPGIPALAPSPAAPAEPGLTPTPSGALPDPAHGPWDPETPGADPADPGETRVNGAVPEAAPAAGEAPQVLVKQEPKEEAAAVAQCEVDGDETAKPEANGDPGDSQANSLLAPGGRSEAGHLLLQKLLRAKNVQLSAQSPGELNGHTENRSAGTEPRPQSLLLGREDPSIARKPAPSKPKRVQKGNERIPASRKKLRKDEGLRPGEALMKQLKQELSLLPLTEPTIMANFSLFAPFGSSPINGKSQLRGAFGSAVLDSVPDYYSQLLTKNNLSNPPTPPSSLPPTPPPSVQQKMVNGVTAPEELGEQPKDADPAREPHSQKDTPAVEVKSLDLLAALPTPPHNQTEDVRMESDDESDSPDSIVTASSPESVLGEELLRFPLLSEAKPELEERVLSPIIPIIPRASIPVFPDTKPYEVSEPFGAPPGKVGAAGPGAPWEKGKSSEVSVMLTVSAAAAKNLNGVMVAMAELLSMKIPSSYEVLFPDGPVRAAVVEAKKVETDMAGMLGGKEKALAGKVPDSSSEWLKQFDAVLPGYSLKGELDLLTLLRQESPAPEKTLHHCYVNNVSNLDVRQLSVLPQEPSPPLSPSVPSPSSPAEPTRVPDPEASHEAAPAPLSPLPPAPSPAPQEEGATAVHSPPRFKPRSRPLEDGDEARPRLKKWKGVRWKRLRFLVTIQKGGAKRDGDKEIAEFIDKLGTTLRPEKVPQDMRKCCFCHEEGDGATDGPARLLNLDLDLWVHLNCALWSTEVYETQGGALINVEVALHRGLLTKCSLCQKTGATNSCNRIRCPSVYHFACAIRAKCMFFKDKTMLCPLHKLKGPCEQELSSFTVFRRVYIERDEVKQIASIIQRGERLHMFRVGGLVFHAIGQLLPHQMADFHSVTALYPVGYEATRIYWSLRTNNRRCCYRCTICENNGRPEFVVQVIEQGLEDLVFSDSSPQAVWNRIIEPVAMMRKEADMLRLFPEYLKGEELFGLTVHAVLRIAESLPGVESCQNYLFRYGRHPLMELPLMINPTGCARSEPKILTHYKRPHTLNSTSMSKAYQSTFTGETNTPYSKQFVHSKSSQYRRLKTEWKNNVYLARSRIQGLGLYAAKDIEKHTMVIEYIGTIIRNEVANRREKIYEEQNRGIYMFRINNEHVIDATLTGGPARYINHSCAPNCVAEVVTFDKEDKIIIISSRRIPKGEELTYDYQFDFEDDQHKIPCHCGAWNCRKWMN
ncbi:histone-lysine N-methyltransferase 2D isoform X1 [Haemorhous mexicanus]|uniref:histone-lysine N-methyltransferase 2D isoform X1 n=1 Tax=Haemorhous mexicanus TaxID=30427 RepID=UPI0028BE1401|nr:histone-lysine N-methyltransferase 2D isoform X1 [Haemorhous mexicanus]XP_059727920.1 histone-lysine N-methyltransferase 2D isoform X1 [Haemorhous mexicanus]